IVSGSDDTTLKVWDAASGKEQLTLKGHTGAVWSVAFSTYGKRIVSGSDDTTLKVWDAASGTEQLTLKGHTTAVSSAAFSPDGTRIVSLSGVFRLALSPDGARIVTGDGHNLNGGGPSNVQVWDALTGEEMLTLRAHRGPVYSVAFSPDGKRI